MAKCFHFATLVILSLFETIEGVASAFDDTQHENVFEIPVRYDGDQVWSVEFPLHEDISELMSMIERFG